MFGEEDGDGGEDARVGDVGVCGGVVGHEEIEEDEDEILQRQGEPVDVAPVGGVGDDAGEEAGEEQAQHEPGGDDRDGGCAPGWGRQVADEGEHYLLSLLVQKLEIQGYRDGYWSDGGHRGEEAKGQEDAVGVCKAEAQPHRRGNERQ